MPDLGEGDPTIAERLKFQARTALNGLGGLHMSHRGPDLFGEISNHLAVVSGTHYLFVKIVNNKNYYNK